MFYINKIVEIINTNAPYPIPKGPRIETIDKGAIILGIIILIYILISLMALISLIISLVLTKRKNKELKEKINILSKDKTFKGGAK